MVNIKPNKSGIGMKNQFFAVSIVEFLSLMGRVASYLKFVFTNCFISLEEENMESIGLNSRLLFNEIAFDKSNDSTYKWGN